jgi:hypothetical protein
MPQLLQVTSTAQQLHCSVMQRLPLSNLECVSAGLCRQRAANDTGLQAMVVQLRRCGHPADWPAALQQSMCVCL